MLFGLDPNSPVDALYFRTFGFVVLRQFFDPRLIAAEIDRVMQDGRRTCLESSGGPEIHFQYVPMMTAETPGSLSLLDRTGPIAAALFGCAVLPTRAKGVRYSGNTHGMRIPMFRLRVWVSWPISNRSENEAARCASYLGHIGPSSLAPSARWGP
jgi:hypothetical protein